VSKHSATKLTYADYLQFPDDGLRHEIIEGEHYVTGSPITKHQRILLMLSYLLQSHLEGHPGGQILFAPFDVLLSEFNVFVPDLIYLSKARAPQLTAKNLQGAPDLVVEILSASTRARDVRLKRDVYDRTGVVEYWTIDPEHEVVTVHRRAPGTPAGSGFDDIAVLTPDDVVTTPLLPQLQLSIEKLFS